MFDKFRDGRMDEQSDCCLEREFINKAFQIPCRDTLYYHSKKNTDRPVFVTTYNPSLPQLNSIIRKYFPILTARKRGSEAFKMFQSLLTDAQKTYVIF